MNHICARCVIQPRSVIPTLLGLPYDAGSSFMRGPASAPKFIRRALGSGASNTWSENLRDITGPGGLVDGGDLALTDADPRAAIEAGVRALVDRGGSPLLLGGDHSVTYPAMRAVRAFHPTLTILHIDAHSDLYHEFGGNPNSHACPFARVMEEGLADRLVQVGIRTLNVQQRAQATRYGVEMIAMREWAGGQRPVVSGPVYLSLDLDALDPAFAPGVSHREPGGLSVREVLTLIQSMGGTLIGADVVELNPLRDESGATAEVAAKFVKEITDRMLNDATVDAGHPETANAANLSS